jgi:hypothetical protein
MENPPRSNRAVWIVVALVFLAGAALVAWRVVEGQQEAPPPVVEVPQPPAQEPTPPAVDLAEGDAQLKANASGLSADPELEKWLSQPDLIRRLVGAVVQVNDGQSPREMLGFLAPGGSFAVDEQSQKPVRRGAKRIKKSFISPKSNARYDVIARVLGSVDAAEVGKLYVQLRPFADAAFREIAPAGKQFEPTFSSAVDHLAAVPLTDAPLEVAPMATGVGYQFVEPALEALSPAQKQLLRMGPANARVIVRQLQAFRSAIGPTDAGS